MTNQTTPAVLTRKAAAVYIGVCTTTLDRLTDLPRVNVRGRVFYRPADIETWLERNAKPRTGKSA
ncbi:MAG: helix-turn-helix domain-containing protein [Treponema sp.]|jgi:hypothetical protein|nr:helix-turn-helix domain-containing protein [Treponema sp.]